MSVEEQLWNVLPVPAAGGADSREMNPGFCFALLLLLWRLFLYVLGHTLPQCPFWKGSGVPLRSQETVEVTHLINICPKILP